MRCQDIMQTPVRWVSSGDSSLIAARVMRDENIGFLPVCDQSGRFVGTVTDRDIATRVVAEGMPPGTLVSEIMSTGTVTCSPEDDIAVAEDRMSESKKSRIVCVDEGGHVRGIISVTDLMLHDDNGQRVLRTMRRISQRGMQAVTSSS